MPSVRHVYRKITPKILRNLIRAFRLNSAGIDISLLPDLTYVVAINRFTKSSLNTGEMLNYHYNSPSQIHQDLLAHLICKTKFFVEFGACDGIESSNTFWLEKNHGWGGILAEPGQSWFPQLYENRSARIVAKAVASESGKKFLFTDTANPVYSTFSNLRELDAHAFSRIDFTEYTVESISLDSLLEESGAPRVIGYLSIDTEGSEFEILRAFDFSKYCFELISVEHNFTPNEKLIDELLLDQGYRRVLREISGGDAWYINNSLADKFESF